MKKCIRSARGVLYDLINVLCPFSGTLQLRNFSKAEFTYTSLRGEWPSGLYSLRQVTEVKLGRVRSDFGWVTTEA